MASISVEKNIFIMKYNRALVHSYQSKKELQKMLVRVNGQDLRFSPGKHNQLQKQILEVFAPKFAQGCECLYVGDSADRDMYKNTQRLKELGFDITLEILPDVVLYVPEKKWLFFVDVLRQWDLWTKSDYKTLKILPKVWMRIIFMSLRFLILQCTKSLARI